MRTIDVAVVCFPERPFKAALTAAQKAVRGLVKALLIRRYKTERNQTIYGLSERGAAWLDERGVDAAASVRRVSDMTNPEHRLWMQFLVLCCEARGLRAQTESELLSSLNVGKAASDKLEQHLLTVRVVVGKAEGPRSLRPDLVCFEGEDACAWIEVDRSKRSSDREASLRALVLAMGSKLANGKALRQVVVFAKSERISKRALAVIDGLVREHKEIIITEGRRQVRTTEQLGGYEVWVGQLQRAGGRRSEVVDKLVGRVAVQLIPTWLPKVRIDATNRHSLEGWFVDNYLPFVKASDESPWPKPVSPLLQ